MDWMFGQRTSETVKKELQEAKDKVTTLEKELGELEAKQPEEGSFTAQPMKGGRRRHRSRRRRISRRR